MRPRRAWIALALGIGLPVSGCRAPAKYRFASDSPAVRASAADASLAGDSITGPVQPAALVNPAAWQAETQEVIPTPADSSSTPSAIPSVEHESSAAVLDVDWLVAEVLTRNPDVRSAAAAWRAASLRYPQEIALDDPMFGYMLGPGSWGDPTVSTAYTLEASQKLPWPGKRRLRGNVAQAEANAMYYDVGEQRLRIAETARMAFYDYFLAHRQLAVLQESNELLDSFRDVAKSKYEAAEVEQQDVLLADVELAQLQRRRLEINRQLRVAQARINTLLMLPADAPLPPPPTEMTTLRQTPTAEELRSLALSQRPELAAQQARIRAERYSLQLACKEFYPDFEVIGRYDAFWQETPLRPMVGMNLNMPLYKDKRRAAVAEARARLAQEQAALDAKISEISFDAEQARQEVIESAQALEVYQSNLLPTARQSIESARASYTSGRLDFLRLIESQRQLLTLQEEYYDAVADFHRRVAELDRAMGTPPARIAASQ